VALRQCAQSGGEFGGQAHFDAIAAVTLHGGPRAIGRQFQQARRAEQMRAPEIDLRAQRVALQPLPLPRRVIGVLDLQRRQRIGRALAERGVQRTDFLHEDRGRPAVGDDVVLGNQQHVFLFRELQQAAADQRPGSEIERCARLGGAHVGDSGRLRVGVETAQIVFGQREAAVRRRDVLPRRAVDADERRAQAFVPRDDPVQARLQRRAIEFAAQPQRGGYVIGRAGGVVELVEEPQALLRP
jgi:hypothetical protein